MLFCCCPFLNEVIELCRSTYMIFLDLVTMRLKPLKVVQLLFQLFNLIRNQLWLTAAEEKNKTIVCCALEVAHWSSGKQRQLMTESFNSFKHARAYKPNLYHFVVSVLKNE